MERKYLSLEAVELKYGETGAVEGYASVFNGVDSYGDTILPGAFAKTLRKRQRPVQMRWNHFGPVIGKWTGLGEDDIGLRATGQLTPGHSVAQDVFALLKHDAISGLSIGYRPIKFRDLGEGRRELQEIELFEISIVEEPADLSARVASVKAAIDEAESLREVEAILRDAGGFSRSDATALVARVKRLARGEREEPELRASDLAELFSRFTTPKE